jgi:hypothetical protein
VRTIVALYPRLLAVGRAAACPAMAGVAAASVPPTETTAGQRQCCQYAFRLAA